MRRDLQVMDDTALVDVTTATLDSLRTVSDHCQRLRSAGLTGDKEMRHLATVPAFIVEKFINDRGITFREFMDDPAHATAMLNDPALSAFRVHEGRVGRVS